MLIAFVDEEVFSRCFEEWVTDKGLELKSDADVRCAITAYTSYIKRVLVDLYDVDLKEGGE